jgi:hypothetical protein
MRHHALVPAVEKTFRKTRQKIYMQVGLSQQESTPIRADGATIEPRDDFPLPTADFDNSAWPTLIISTGPP